MFSIGKENTLSGNTAAGHSRPSMWQRALFPHSPLGLVARLASTGGGGRERERERALRLPCSDSRSLLTIVRTSVSKETYYQEVALTLFLAQSRGFGRSEAGKGVSGQA